MASRVRLFVAGGKGFGVCVFADNHPDRAAEDGQALEAGEGGPQDRQVLRVRHGRVAAAYGHFRAHRPLARLYMVSLFFKSFLYFVFENLRMPSCQPILLLFKNDMS